VKYKLNFKYILDLF